MREDVKFVILDADDIDYIDFSEVLQTSPTSMRYSVDRSKTFVKYKGEQPDFIFEITNDLIGKKEYSHEEFIKIVNGPEWTL
jgi:hypothetical protein|tara:strand:- start:8723 stop:8968 length:246 start_codon:yes stop_codon:yes gene_type:complete